MTVTSRNPGIDLFRAGALAAMVIANSLEHVHRVPGWLKHAPDIGLTVVDLIAPCFVFAIGLTYGASVRRRAGSDGWLAAAGHTLRRSMALIGIGLLFALGQESFGFGTGGLPWGTLPAFGVAILLTFPALLLPWGWRWVVALALLAGYQWLVDNVVLQTVLITSHAGLPGTLSWAAMLMLATGFGDVQGRDGTASRRYLLIALAVLGAGLALALVIPVSKHRMSASFVLIAVALPSLVFWACDHLARRWHGIPPWVQAWGVNPLVLYVAHLVLLSLLLVPPAGWWHAEAPWWLLVPQVVVLMAVLHRVARALHRKGMRISL